MRTNKNIIFLLAPLILIGLFFYGVFRYVQDVNGDFFTYIDSLSVFNSGLKLEDIFSLWNQNNLGYFSTIFQPISFFSRLISILFFNNNLPLLTREIAFYTFLILVLFYSTFFAYLKLQIDIFKKSSYFFPFVATCLYVFGLPMLLQTGLIDNTFHIWAIAPILLVEVIEFIVDSNKRWSIYNCAKIALYISLILTAPPFSFALLITLIPSALLFVMGPILKNWKYSIFQLAIMAFFVVCMGAMFIYPFLVSLYAINTKSFYSANPGAVGFIHLNFGITGIYKMYFDWTREIFYKEGNYHPLYTYYNSIIGIISTIFIWSIPLFAYLCKKSYKAITRLYLFLGVCLLLSVFFIKGIQPPFGGFNSLLYSTSHIFDIFRTPGSKFAVPILLYLSTFVLLYLNSEQNFLIKMTIVFAIFFHILPFFNILRFAGYSKNEYIVKIPQEYKDVVKKINTSTDGAVLLIPGNYSGNFNLHGIKFIGQDVLGKMLKRPIIYSNDTAFPNSKKYIDELTLNLNPTKVGNAGIRYVLVRRDFESIENTSELVDKAWKKLQSDDFELLYKSQLIELYKLKNRYFHNFITFESQDENAKLAYMQISASKYRVSIYSDKPNIKGKLIFRNSFSDNWSLKSQNNLYQVEHVRFDGYANSWNVAIDNTLKKHVTVDIYLKSQIYQYIFTGISVVSLACVIVYLLFSHAKKVDP